MRVAPELVGGPKEEGDGEQNRFEPLRGRGMVDGLVDEVGTRDHGEREGAEEVVGTSRKDGWSGVPYEESEDAASVTAPRMRDGAMGFGRGGYTCCWII